MTYDQWQEKKGISSWSFEAECAREAWEAATRENLRATIATAALDYTLVSMSHEERAKYAVAAADALLVELEKTQ